MKTDPAAAAIHARDLTCVSGSYRKDVIPFVRLMSYQMKLKPKLMSFMARHVEYQVSRYGKPLTAHHLFGQTQIEDTLVNSGSTIWTTTASMHTARWALRNMGRALNPSGWPAKTKKLPVNNTLPYEPEEVRVLLSRSRKLNTDYQRTRMLGILLLGLGAGLDGKDLPTVTGRDIWTGERAVWVHVRREGRERQIPVLARYEEELLRLAREVGDSPFMGVSPKNSANYLSGFLADMYANFNIQPRVNGHRLRATWIASISANASLAALKQATCAKELGGYGYLVEAGPGLTDEQYAAQLRGSSDVLPWHYHGPAA